MMPVLTTLTMGSVAQLFTILAIFVLVLFLTWFTTRFIARYQRATASAHGNIEVIDAYRISQTQVIEVLRIGSRYVAIAVSKDQVARLGEWSEEELALVLPEKKEQAGGSAGMTGFRELLDKVREKRTEE